MLKVLEVADQGETVKVSLEFHREEFSRIVELLLAATESACLVYDAMQSDAYHQDHAEPVSVH